MTEQERRAEYCKRTGRIATSDQSGYFAFCQGIEFGRDACIDLLMDMHKRAGGQHSYYHFAANRLWAGGTHETQNPDLA